MRAENFYQSQTINTISLVLLTEEQNLCDERITPVQRHQLAAQGFKGCLGNIGISYHPDGSINKIYVGAGSFQSDRLAIANVANRLPEGSYVSETPLSHNAMVAWSLTQYQFDRYKPASLTPRILVVDKQKLDPIITDAKAIFLVRDLINTPTNDLGPTEMAGIVEALATEHGAEFVQWVGEDLIRNNFPAIHAVGRAAAQEPRLLSLRWGNENHPKVTLVGKGVCFDSGGLDIKPSSGMRLMKKDMGGAAQVIGLAQWIMTHQLAIRLQVLIPAVENAIDANAYRPGDVLTMRNGLKVEIHNTDAEGRLVLADALVKACEDEPELIIDFATLTGAARVSVGTEIAAMFVNNDELADAFNKSAQETADPVWRMPLFEGYEPLYKSNIADFTNASDSPYAGAITAALFLQRFVKREISWAHFDIMAWNAYSKPGRPEGGEAMGMLAVGKYLWDKYDRPRHDLVEM
jgi:leucyl aminopeptidase